MLNVPRHSASDLTISLRFRSLQVNDRRDELDASALSLVVQIEFQRGRCILQKELVLGLREYLLSFGPQGNLGHQAIIFSSDFDEIVCSNQNTSTGEIMTGWKSRLKWVSLVLRLSLAMQLCAASIGFFLHKSAGSETSSPWLGPPLPNFASWVLASGLVWLAVSIVIGFYRRSSLLTSALLLVVLSWIHLYYDPLYNLSEAVLLLLLSVLGILWIEDQRTGPVTDHSIDSLRRMSGSARSWTSFILRTFVGGIFVSQGFHNTFRQGGVIEFARHIYVQPFHGRLPDWLLWIAGISNPPWELGGGLLLVAGLFTSEACLGMCGFLLIIVFGHSLDGLGGATSGMRDYALANLLCVLIVYAITERDDQISLDHLRRKIRG